MTSPSMDAQATSPWLSVWFRPGRTIQHIVAVIPHRHLWLLAGLAGVSNLVVQVLLSEWRTLLLDWRWIAAIVLGGVILGIVNIYVAAFFLRWSGSLLGGLTSTIEFRAAAAWSSLPTILGAAICLAVLAGLKLMGVAASGSTETITLPLISAAA